MSPNDYWNNWNSWEYYKNKDSVYEINKLAKSLAEISKQMSLAPMFVKFPVLASISQVPATKTIVPKSIC